MKLPDGPTDGWTPHVDTTLRPTMTNYTFSCPECRQHVEVNDPMRDALLRAGCAICGAGVSREDFGRA